MAFLALSYLAADAATQMEADIVLSDGDRVAEGLGEQPAPGQACSLAASECDR